MYLYTFFFSPLLSSFSFLFFSHYGVNSVRICPGSQRAAKEVVGLRVMLSATPSNMVSAIQSQCFQLSWALGCQLPVPHLSLLQHGVWPLTAVLSEGNLLQCGLLLTYSLCVECSHFNSCRLLLKSGTWGGAVHFSQEGYIVQWSFFHCCSIHIWAGWNLFWLAHSNSWTSSS